MTLPAEKILDRQSSGTAASATQWSVRTYLVCLVLACLLPGMIGAVALFAYEFREGRRQLEKDTILTARALGQAVDNQILRVQGLALGLAAADSLARGDLAGFHRQARQVLAHSRLGATAALADRSGEQILNTGEEYGRPLPGYGNPDLVRAVFERGEPVISDLFVSKLLQRPIMAVAVPVIADGQRVRVLAVSVLPEQFNGILKAQGLPPGWVATIFDGTGTIVARSREAEIYVGQKPAEGYFAGLMAADEGTFEAVMKDGVPVLAAHTRSAATNWRVAISIPSQGLVAGTIHRLSLLAAGVAGLFILGLGLAWLMGGRIARSFHALVGPAYALGAGEAVRPPPVGVWEASELAAALEKAAQLLKERTARLQESNDSLLEKERQLAEAHRLAKFGTWSLDPASGQVTTSDAVREIYGRDIPPFEQQRGTLLTVKSWEKVNAAAQRLAETGGYDLELQVNHGSGGIIWVNAKCVAVRDGDGKVVLLRGTVQDITERKQAEERMAEQEEILRATFQQAAVGICHVSPLGYFLRANRKLCDMLGYSEAELQARRFADVTYPPDREIGLADFRRSMAGEIRTFTAEKRYQRRDGSILWVRIAAAAVRDRTSGAARFNAVIIEDISEQKHAEQQLRENGYRLALALKAGGSAVWELDVASQTLLPADDQLFTILGYAPGEFVTLPDWLALVHADERAGVPEMIDGLIRGVKESYCVELRLRSRGGGWRWVLSQAVAAERDAEGRALRLVGTLTDITARKEAEAEIQRLNAELEKRVQERTAQLELSNEALMRSNMELQRFAHAAAHDLQTPLRSIAGFSQLLQRELQDCMDEQAEEWLGLVIGNTRRLQTLIQELLAYSRLDAQARPFEPVDMADVFRQVVASLATPIEEAGAEVGAGPLPTLLADRTQMAQLLQNLLENGIKYNRSRPPRVRVSCQGRQGEWQFAVADNGIGIAPRHHARIFEIFRRLHSHQEIPGTGIGLAICQRIVARHGGRIWVESEAGKGCVFRFTLPAGEAPGEAPGAAGP